MISKRKAHIGDRIKFRVTTRDGTRTATRQVTGHDGDRYEVRYSGHTGFIVRPDEVLAVYEHDDDDGGARQEALWQARMAGDMEAF